MWDDLMEFVHRHVSSHVQIGQATGWIALVTSTVGVMVAGVRLLGAITPDGVNQWILLLISTITGGTAVGCLAYARIVAARQDGETLEVCHELNRREMMAGRPPRFPHLIPKAAGPWFDPSANGVAAPTIIPKDSPK